MLKHCTTFMEYDIWFLSNTDKFIDRKLYLGRCPNCLSDIALLRETRIADNKVFDEKAIGYRKVKNICDKVRHHILFTKLETKVIKGKPCGWIYGENKEIKNKKGQTVKIRQSACDFYNQKELIKVLK